MGGESQDVARLLRAWSAGDLGARDALVRLVYDEVRSLAARVYANVPEGDTLQPTALAHEVQARLLGMDRVAWEGREHFFAIVGAIMRNVLVDRARQKGARKRGGGMARAPLRDGLADPKGTLSAAQLIALDVALRKLEAQNPRHAQVVEMRFFGGLTVEEVGTTLGVTPATVVRDWRAAKAWLYCAIEGEARHD